MALFLDTSALVKLFVAEPGSPEVLRLCEEDTVLYISSLARHEFLATLQRKQRERRLAAPAVADFLADFRRKITEGALQLVLVTEAVDQTAFALLERHGLSGLRTLDAFHLASCRFVPGAIFVLADRQLADIASKEGIPTTLIE